jgi:polyisoprenoid-binding protein YceI
MTTLTDPTTTAPALPLGTWRIDPVHSTIGFEVRDMAHLFATIRGRFTDFDGTVQCTPDGARAAGTIRVASLTTDHADRDENLRSVAFLDANGSPEMRFESDAVEVEDDGTVRIAGRLELKGMGSDVELRGRVLGCGIDHRGSERLAIVAEGALPFGPMHVGVVVDVSAVKDA